eukprot:3687328-Amphidinium_carterae.1
MVLSQDFVTPGPTPAKYRGLCRCAVVIINYFGHHGYTANPQKYVQLPSTLFKPDARRKRETLACGQTRQIISRLQCSAGAVHMNDVQSFTNLRRGAHLRLSPCGILSNFLLSVVLATGAMVVAQTCFALVAQGCLLSQDLARAFARRSQQKRQPAGAEEALRDPACGIGGQRDSYNIARDNKLGCKRAQPTGIGHGLGCGQQRQYQCDSRRAATLVNRCRPRWVRVETWCGHRAGGLALSEGTAAIPTHTHVPSECSISEQQYEGSTSR